MGNWEGVGEEGEREQAGEQRAGVPQHNSAALVMSSVPCSSVVIVTAYLDFFFSYTDKLMPQH